MEQGTGSGVEALGDRELLDALVNRVSWISAPTATAAGAARDLGPGSWLLRRDVHLAPLLTDPGDGSDLRLLRAELVLASTGDARALLDRQEVLEVRSLGGSVPGAGRADVTEHLFVRGTRVDHLAIGIVHLEDRPAGPTGSAAAPRAPRSVLAALVLQVAAGSGGGQGARTIVVGTDAAWSAAPAGISFLAREEPGRRMLEIHDAREEDIDLAWARFGSPHTASGRAWRPAVDRGRHPSLVHPDLVLPPPLVAETLVHVGERVLTERGVQCFDLGAPVCARPVIALPEGSRRPVTVWAGAVPGSPPRGGDVRIDTGGEPTVLEAHGTVWGRWLHVHGAPDVPASGTVLPARMGILPRPPLIDVSDDVLAGVLGDGFAGLAARSQETYVGEEGVPLLADVARTARAAILLGGDTYRSARALDAFLATARSTAQGMVVDAVAPGGPAADLDEHTFALPGWIADQAGASGASRRSGAVAGGIARRILARAEDGPDPAARMSTLAAAVDALAAVRRMRRSRTGAEEGADQELRACEHALRERGRELLRARRGGEGGGAWLDATGEGSSAAATALAVLVGLTTAEDSSRDRAALRPLLDAPPTADLRGLGRAALVRLGETRAVLAAHAFGDDVPPVLLVELLVAATGLVVDGDRIHVRTPSLALEDAALTLPHPRGEVSIRWEGARGEILAPAGTHVLHHRTGAAAPVWYNSGTTALDRPRPAP